SEIVITHEPEKKRLISVKDGCSSYSLPIQEPIYLPINLEGAKHFRGSATLEVLGGIINDDKTVSRISMLTTSGFNIYHGEFRDENDAISERMLVDNPLFRKLKLKVRDYDGEGFSLDSNFVLHMVGKTPIWFREDFPLVPGKKLWMKMLPNGPKEVRNPGWFQIEMNEEGKIVHSDTGESIDPEWFKDYEQYAELFHEQHDLESEDDMNTVGKIFNESIMFSGMDNSIIPITGLSFIR
ncbi:hypothetical protein KKF04_05225, partial [Patescibacteria group bacterium]|nr:hypothetical protein [Patescibacteria group bacterium]